VRASPGRGMAASASVARLNDFPKNWLSSNRALLGVLGVGVGVGVWEEWVCGVNGVSDI